LFKLKFYQGLALAAITTLLLSFGGIALIERALAQAGTLTYGSVVTANIALAAPLGSYTFSGAAGDFVEIEVVSTTEGFNPNLTIVTPSNALLTAIDDDVFGFGNGDAYASAVLPEDGTYTVLISAVFGTEGGYVVRLNGRLPPAAPYPSLQLGVPQAVVVENNPAPQFFTFEASICPTTLSVVNNSQGEPFSFPYAVIVRDERGERVGELRGGRQLQSHLVVEPNSGRYEVEVLAADPRQNGTFTLVVSCPAEVPICVFPVGSSADLPVPPPSTYTNPNLPQLPTPPPQVTTPPNATVPPPVSTCRSVTITQPTNGGGLPNGAATIFWDPAPGASFYEVVVRNNENGATVGTNSTATSASLDVSSAGPLGTGFGTFTVTVSAYAGSPSPSQRRFLCSGEVTVQREAPGGGNPGGGTCGNDVCEASELSTTGITAVFTCTRCAADCPQLRVCP
jgi:hypothetical protein